MNRLEYQIELEDGRVFLGTDELTEGEAHIHPVLPKGIIRKATAFMTVALPDEARIFINGFQTWTYCPEYDKSGYTRSFGKLPGFLIHKFSLDRYGDYHFTDYPQLPGHTQGENYCYFRNGDRFHLIASLDEKPGYTLFRYDAEKSLLTIERDCAGILCDGKYAAFDLFLKTGTESEVFDGWFAALGIKPRTTDKIAGYSSWYNRYQNISEESILADLNSCRGILREGDLFQIDDGWEPYVGDWLHEDVGKFPYGLKASASRIHEAGFRSGLWLAPFIAEKKSELFQKHPDWLLKHRGEPFQCGCNWSGYYALDIDNPDFVEYLRKVFDRVFNEWNIDLVKLDFLYGAAPFGTDRETRSARMIRAMELLRELCGDHLILACGVPFMSAFGIADYCRVSCDVGLDWDDRFYMRWIHRERVSTKRAIENSFFRRQINGRAYLSDPDVFFLRDSNIRLTDEQKDKLAVSCALLGGVFLTSDNMTEYDSRKIEKYQYLRNLAERGKIERISYDPLKIHYVLDGESREVEI